MAANIAGTYGLYAITDCEHFSDEALLRKTEKILETGVALLQYRNKDLQGWHKRTVAAKIQSLCRYYETPFIVNDDPALADDIGADGVHLGKNDVDITIARQALGDDKLIGISCYNSLKRAMTAQHDGADYITFGAFFPSVTKPDAVMVNADLLKQARLKLMIPIVAIGGITPENGKTLISAGANYLAAISGLYSAGDIVKTVKAYKRLFDQ